jgi:hypothetical protein
MERSGKGWDELLKRYRISGIVDTEKGWEVTSASSITGPIVSRGGHHYTTEGMK